MGKTRQVKPFYLVVIDEDNHVFNVVGPLQYDDEWNRKIVEAQNQGRSVRCYAHPAQTSRNLLVNELSRAHTCRYSDSLIIEEPEDRSAEYAGPLPVYARNANRKRVVRFLCRGACNCERWGEMNVDYPSEEILRRSQLRDYSARCLKCGYVANDPYKWYR